MHFNTRVIAAASLYLTANAQWLQGDEYYGSFAGQVIERSVEDSDLLYARSYYPYDDLYDDGLYMRSLNDFDSDVYIRDAAPIAGGGGSKGAAKSEAKPAAKSEGKSAAKSEGKSAAKNEAKAPSSAKEGKAKDGAAKAPKAEGGKTEGKAGKDGSKPGQAKNGSATPSAAAKARLSSTVREKLAAKYGEGKWTFNRSSGKSYLTLANGEKMRFMRGEDGKLRRARVRTTGSSTKKTEGSAGGAEGKSPKADKATTEAKVAKAAKERTAANFAAAKAGGKAGVKDGATSTKASTKPDAGGGKASKGSDTSFSSGRSESSDTESD